jgi:hypothetical protein
VDVLAGLIQTHVQKKKNIDSRDAKSQVHGRHITFVYFTLYILSVFVGPLTGIILKEISGFSGYIAL